MVTKKITPGTPPVAPLAANPEGAAAAPSGLDALAAEAQEAFAPDHLTDLDVAEADGKGAVPVMSNAQSLMMAAQMLRATLESVAGLKSPAVTMADAKLQPCADALGAVFDKHGWNLQEMAGGYMLELTAVATVAPVAWAAYAGIQAEIKADKAKRVDTPAPPAAGVPPAPPPIHTTDTGAAVFAPNDPRSVSLNS